jgi:hypothetical protein
VHVPSLVLARAASRKYLHRDKVVYMPLPAPMTFGSFMDRDSASAQLTLMTQLVTVITSCVQYTTLRKTIVDHRSVGTKKFAHKVSTTKLRTDKLDRACPRDTVKPHHAIS